MVARLRRMRARPIGLSIVLMMGTVAAGLALRFVPLGLPTVVVKYGGSTMWALMIYWVVTMMLPRMRLGTAVMVSGAIATAVEFGKLIHSPGLDAFRGTLPGILLLGKYFSTWDILAYWLAIGVGGLVDSFLRRR